MDSKSFIGSLISIIIPIFMISCNEIIEDEIQLENARADGSILQSETMYEYYYWFNGEKKELIPLKNVYYVSSSDNKTYSSPFSISSNSAIKNIIKKGMSENVETRYWWIVEIVDNDKNQTNSLAQNLNLNDIFVAPVFGSSIEDCIATSEYFYVKTTDNGKATLESFAKEHSVEIISEIEYVPNWYILKAPKNSNGLQMSNIFYESGKFEDIDPAFMFNFKTNECPAEPNFSQQWSADYMDLCKAWDITKGKSDVVIAVLDQGVDQSHKEFANNYSSLSYDLITKKTPSVVRGDHGTHVGGIIGANHNNIQIAGVAPDCMIMSISHTLNTTTTTISSDLASGIGYARIHGASVINNSWGDQGGRLYNNLHSAVLEDAIKTAIKTGRNGKGMVVLFASGNYNKNGVDYPGNCSPDILVVGSINKSYNRSDFSSYGNSLDIVAPGSDILSTMPGNKIDFMSGTSMATPHVAGVAALILSLNPDLTGKEVVDIIEKSAQKIGPYTYTKTSDRTNGTWNQEVGYGLCNAFAAVSTVLSDVVKFNDKIITDNTSISGSIIQSKNITISNNALLNMTFEKSLTINSPFTIDKGAQLYFSTK